MAQGLAQAGANAVSTEGANELLLDALEATIKELRDDLAASRADVARLREALKYIRELTPTPTKTLSWEQNVDRIAAEALAATQDPPIVAAEPAPAPLGGLAIDMNK
jgi:NAD(P)-dependent dehydrogenase (short-subunit alcohol dehydrogenase family)